MPENLRSGQGFGGRANARFVGIIGRDNAHVKRVYSLRIMEVPKCRG